MPEPVVIANPVDEDAAPGPVVGRDAVSVISTVMPVKATAAAFHVWEKVHGLEVVIVPLAIVRLNVPLPLNQSYALPESFGRKP